jgi:hypothetical protein
MMHMSFNGILLYIQKYYTRPDGEFMEGQGVRRRSTFPLLSYSEISNDCVFSCLAQ